MSSYWAFFFTIMAKEIQLTQGKVAIVDDSDYEELSKYKWYANCIKGTYYAVHTINKKSGCNIKILMHRFILNAKKGIIIDHINRDTLNNSRSNLRECNHKENRLNSKLNKNNKTGFRGVSIYGKTNKFTASIKLHKNTRIGIYENSIDAAKAYNEYALKYNGKFAKLNQI